MQGKTSEHEKLLKTSTAGGRAPGSVLDPSNLNQYGEPITSLRSYHCSNSGVLFAHLNMNSLIAKLDWIRLILRKCSLDVLALSETKLDDSISNNFLCFEGLELFRKDRSRRGGGVCLYVSRKLCSSPIPAPDSLNNIEVIRAEICLIFRQRSRERSNSILRN